MEIAADYYDGKSSERHSVILCLCGDSLQLKGGRIEASWPLTVVRVADPLGVIKCAVYLPDGGKCDFDNREFARRIEQAKGKSGFFHGVHRWENNLKRAFVALALTTVLILGFIRFGIPVLAERAAYAIPSGIEARLGDETLQFLDRAMFKPTALDAVRQAELEQLFSRVVTTLDATERPYRLALRSSPKVGANAFALPGGTVILTDELVGLAGQDEELAAVLAHEVGHVLNRHAMRQVIQGSAVGLVIATLTGDVFSASSLAAALPTMLVDAKFSRDMELEADDVAVEYLRQRGESVEHFAAILTGLEQAFAKNNGQTASEQRTSGYFSSHPATKERIERLAAPKGDN
ncbi:MAG TPA: M48 family metallopeptidase [Malonomonas sp.]